MKLSIGIEADDQIYHIGGSLRIANCIKVYKDQICTDKVLIP